MCQIQHLFWFKTPLFYSTSERNVHLSDPFPVFSTQTCRGSSAVMNCEPLSLQPLCSPLRKNRHRWFSRGPPLLPAVNTCCCQMHGAFIITPNKHLARASILYLWRKNPSSSLSSAWWPLMSSSWLLLKPQKKEAWWRSAAPPFLELINLQRSPMFFFRHHLEKDQKQEKMTSTHTYWILSHSRPTTPTSVTCSGFHLLPLHVLSVLAQSRHAQRRLCSSSQWRCSESSTGWVRELQSAQWLWGLCIPGL